MRIERVLLAPVEGAFFYDDQAAIRAGAAVDGAYYQGPPATAGFSAVRIPAAALSIGFVLGNGLAAWGDAMTVQYAAAAGRDPVFAPATSIAFLEKEVVPILVGRSVREFRTNCEWMNSIRMSGGKPLSAALRYGLSQAFLRAAAFARHCTMAEVIHEDFDLPQVVRRIPVYAQSGDDRYLNTDKMILKQVDVLPHGLINSPAKFGPDGQKFLEFLEWVVNRIVTHGVAGYLPRLHFDLYGTAGFAFDQDIDRVAAFLCDAGRIAKATQLCIESPMDFGGTPQQIEGYAALRQRLDDLGSQVKIAADEWCNTIEDVRNFVKAGAADVIQIKAPDLGGLDQSVLAIELCKREGVGAFLGGSCAETDLSARACVHIAVAAQAEMQLAKPGMGVDEGVMIVRNEQQRLLMQLALQEHTRFIAADSYVLNGPAL